MRGGCEWFRLQRGGWCWRFLWYLRGNDRRSYRYGRDGCGLGLFDRDGNWRRWLRLDRRLYLDARGHHGRRRNVRLWKGSRNRDGLTNFGGGGGRSGCSNLNLEFTDGALQFGELLGVFFGEVVQLFAKLGVPDVQRNGQNRSGEQHQTIENGEEYEKGHGYSRIYSLGYSMVERAGAGILHLF